jgi:hypothetical protein
LLRSSNGSRTDQLLLHSPRHMYVFTGSNAVVGDPSYNNNNGTVCCPSAGFVQQAQLIGIGAPVLTLNYQGSAVALSADGNTALIGGPGQIYDTGATRLLSERGQYPKIRARNLA